MNLQVPNVSTLNVGRLPHLKRGEKSNAPVRDLSKRPPVCTTSNIEILGQGETHRVKMKSKGNSQTTDTVVADWQTSCETHGPAILSQASGNISKHQPNGKRLEKSTLAASTLACCVFTCTNPSKFRIRVQSDIL